MGTELHSTVHIKPLFRLWRVPWPEAVGKFRSAANLFASATLLNIVIDAQLTAYLIRNVVSKVSQ